MNHRAFHIASAAIAGFAVACSALAADEHDPAAELASFQIADGFAASLFASEKDGVIKPIQIRFDARGRLWVIGSTVYPQLEPGQKPDDKVLILEDTDRDGRCDKTTVFADGLMIPTGLELGDGGAYVGHGTELLFLKDTDGDDKADERRVVLRGFGTGDNHQNINSFRWGPGGELWFSQGLHTHSHVETPWGIARLEQAGLWRLRPRLLKLEGFYGSHHEPQNPWGYVFTDWGEPIVIAGNNSSAIYPVPGLVPNRRDDPPPLIWKNGNGRKSSGGEIVGTTHFPESWQGVLILGGYINNAVWALKISDDGSGFALEDLPPLIKSTSRNFRPVDVKFGPDGALYLCDWYNPIIGHYQASFRHPDRDKKHGRIWRVTATGRPLTQPPTLPTASIPDLLEHLKSADRWTRAFAKRSLADRPTEQVIAALSPWSQRSELSERVLVEALGVFKSHESLAPELLFRLCRAKEPSARAYAASVVGAWADRLPDPLGLLRPLLSDEHPRVRLQALVACAYVRKPEAIEAAAIATDFPTDKFLDYAWKQAVFSLKPHWLAAFKTGRLNFENKADRLGWLVRADGTKDTVEAVRNLLRGEFISGTTREKYLGLLTEVGDENDLASILALKDLALQSRLLPPLARAQKVRSLRPTGDLAAALRPLLESPDPNLRSEALRLAGIWKLNALQPAVEAAAINPAGEPVVRRAAIEALGHLGGAPSAAILARLAADEKPTIQSAAVVALTGVDLKEAARLGTAGLIQLKDEAAATEIFSAFLQRQGGATALATAMTNQVPPKVVAEAGLRLMSASGRRDETLARILSEAAGMNLQGLKLSPVAWRMLPDEVRISGDARRGAEIFRRPALGCLACHAVNGEGGTLGPNLSALGTAQPVDFIIGAILDPQKEIKEGYMSISVTTKDGEEYQGYQVRESSGEVVLRDSLRNQEVRLPRSSIREKKQNGSVMPAGLVDSLNRSEFRDLVRFLSELGKPK